LRNVWRHPHRQTISHPLGLL